MIIKNKNMKVYPAFTSRLTHMIYYMLKAKKIDFEIEYMFHPTRRWRFDFAIVYKKIAIEAEGGIYKSGRHVRAIGYNNDCEKYNNATLLGWKVYRFTDMMIKDNSLTKFICLLLKGNLGSVDGGIDG